MKDGAGRTAAWEFRTGWPTLAGATLGLATGALTIFYFTQGLFFAPLGEAFGWTRSQLSMTNLIGGVEVAFASVIVGWLVDRYGVRGPALVAYIIIALAFVGLSLAGPSLPLFMALQLLVLGCGAANGPPNYTRAINQSFDRARGMALGLAMAGAGAMAIIAPPVMAWVIQGHGWRAGYQALALVTVISAPIVLVLLSRGRRPGPAQVLGAPEVAPSLAAALGNLVFLRLLAAFALAAVGMGGLNLHLVALLLDQGYDLSHAAGIQGLIGLSMLVGRLLFGYLADRFFAPRVGALAIALAAVGLFLLAGFGGAAAPATAVLVGLAMGAEADVIGYVTARYFGLPAYGRLFGLLYGAYTIGLGGGGFLLARMQASFGGYGPGLVAAGVLTAAGAALLAGAPRFTPAA